MANDWFVVDANLGKRPIKIIIEEAISMFCL